MSANVGRLGIFIMLSHPTQEHGMPFPLVKSLVSLCTVLKFASHKLHSLLTLFLGILCILQLLEMGHRFHFISHWLGHEHRAATGFWAHTRPPAGLLPCSQWFFRSHHAVKNVLCVQQADQLPSLVGLAHLPTCPPAHALPLVSKMAD